MNFLKYVFFVTATVVLVFSGHSDALLTNFLGTTPENIISQALKDVQANIIVTSTSGEGSVAAEITIQSIRDAASKCIADGVSPLAVNIITDGVLSTIKLVAVSVNNTKNVIDAAVKIAVRDPAAAIEAIENELNSELVFIAGVPVFEAQGSALALLGGEAIDGFKNAVISIQTAGHAMIRFMEITEQMAKLGIKAGGTASEKGLKAARATIVTGEITVYVNLLKSAKQAFEVLRNSASKGLSQTNLVSGILDSLKTNISIGSPAGLVAIEKLNTNLAPGLNIFLKKSTIDASKIMKQGIVVTILKIGEVIAALRNSLEAAGNSGTQDSDVAVASVRMAIKLAQEKLMSESAFAFLGIGAARQIAGKTLTSGIISALMEIERVIVATFIDLRLAGSTVEIAFQTGGLAAPQGISAALQICEAAENSLNARLSVAAGIVFDVLKML